MQVGLGANNNIAVSPTPPLPRKRERARGEGHAVTHRTTRCVGIADDETLMAGGSAPHEAGRKNVALLAALARLAVILAPRARSKVSRNLPASLRYLACDNGGRKKLRLLQLLTRL